MIKVSVIIPVYNVEAYLPDCLYSVENQTLNEIEIICVNDASTDGSLDILKKFQKKDKRIKVLENMKNRGVSYTRNRGMELAGGKYIYFLDSDDMIAHNTLKELFEEAEKRKTDVLFFDGWTKYENADLEKNFKDFQNSRKHDYKDTKKGKDILCDFVRNMEWSPMVQGQFWRREFLNARGISFYEGIVHEDELFSFIAVLQAERAGYVNRKYFCRRYRENSIMTSEMSTKRFYGCFTAYYYMNKFMHLNKYYMEESRALIARIYSIMRRIYQRFKDSYDLSEGLQNEELKNAFYVFCSTQDAYMAYGNIDHTVLQKIMKYKDVFIYGAGVIGNAVYEKIINEGIGVSGFIVTAKEDNPNYLNGHPVLELEHLECDKEESIIVVAVKEAFQESIVRQLKARGYLFIRYNESL